MSCVGHVARTGDRRGEYRVFVGRPGRKDRLQKLGTLVVRCTGCAPDGHLLRVTIPDATSIQFNLLMISK